MNTEDILIKSIINHNMDTILNLFEDKGAYNFYNTTINNDSLILYCIKHKLPQLLNLLIRFKFNINNIGKGKTTALHAAVINNNYEITKILLDNDCELSLFNDNHLTPLHIAIKNKNIQISELLINYGADVGNQGYNYVTPLHLACKEGIEDIVLKLILHGAPINSLDEELSTPFHIACKFGHLNIINILYQYGANVHKKNINGQTGLHVASIYGHSSLIHDLIDVMHLSVHENDNHMNTPLHLAVRYKQRRTILELMKKMANLDQNNDYGSSLHECVDDIVVLNFLIRLLADVNRKNKNGQTALHLASKLPNNNGYDSVLLLLLSKAEIDIQDAYGNTALHYSIIYKNEKITNLLIEKGANESIPNSNNETPFSLLNNLY